MKVTPADILICMSVLLCPALRAQEANTVSAPAYFGPNCLPVPMMLDGTVSPKIYAELGYDLAAGYHGDITQTIQALIHIPVFTPRVNLTCWMPVVEFYRNTPESLAWQRPRQPMESGYEFGNVCISTDIHVLKQGRIRPDITVRAAFITASGDSDEYARYFDAPGYFFDASIAKSLDFEDSFVKSLRLAVSGGFLCWQTGRNKQNDAYMYGVMTKLDTRLFDFSVAWQGYSGWKNDGDRPMVIRTVLSFQAKNFRPYLKYEHGFRDYPFNIWGIGLGYRF